MSKKINILVLASTFPRWKGDSTPPFVLELEKRLAKKMNIRVLAPHANGAKKQETMDGVLVTRFQYFWPAHLQKLCYDGGILPNLKKNKLLYFQGVTLILFEFLQAVKIIKKEKIQLIHAHWIIPQGIVALAIKKILGIPYVVTTHGGDIYGLQQGIFFTIKKIVLNNAKKITVVSSAIKEEIQKKINPLLDVEVIPMGVDSQLFNPNKFDKKLKNKYSNGSPLLLFVGRLAEKKGVTYLIKAMSQIVKRFPQAKLLIVGEGPLEKELKELSNSLQLKRNIFFLGALPNEDLPRYYATADIFVGPSIKTKEGDTEGLGLTFVEASFSGCIPIGTDIGGISDVIRDNETGFLLKQKDHNSIAVKVGSLLNNNEIKLKIKKNLRLDTVKKFDWQYVQQKYSDLMTNSI